MFQRGLKPSGQHVLAWHHTLWFILFDTILHAGNKCAFSSFFSMTPSCYCIWTRTVSGLILSYSFRTFMTRSSMLCTVSGGESQYCRHSCSEELGTCRHQTTNMVSIVCYQLIQKQTREQREHTIFVWCRWGGERAGQPKKTKAPLHLCIYLW